MNILDKITERDARYDIATSEVFELFTEEFVKGVGLFINSFDIEWKSIGLHPVINECILIEGIATINIDSNIILNDGTPITITEENQHEYRQLVGFIFPIILIEHGTAEDVVEYMKDIVEINKSIDKDVDIKTLIAKYANNASNEPIKKALLDELKKYRNNQVNTVRDFDNSTLTEFQKSALSMHSNKNKRVH